ncbi:MAG: malto-oligosyltrehalose synthase, partial [Actinomycetes bacterium]
MEAIPGQRRTPSSTYRLQLTPDFGFDAAADLVGYVARLGVTHLYLSPVLEAVPGSLHGYDVVDHSRLRTDLGGEVAFDRLQAAARGAGLGIVVDVVPNHMAVPTPASLNRQLWSVLRDGPTSPYAHWFDIDWTTPEHALVMPVLGQRIGDCVEAGEIGLDRSGPEPLLRYFDHSFPIRPGTAELPLVELLDRQWYRLAFWRVAGEELNYRRFFDVDTLAGIRVEHADVFDASHAVLLDLVRSGAVDGLRIDHPDGLADPRGYLRRLHVATDGAWLVVEKILEDDEELPTDWPCAGTTGYDALLRASGVFLDPGGGEPLRALYAGISEQPAAFDAVVDITKRVVIGTSLRAEVAHLVDLLAQIGREDLNVRDHTSRGFEVALVEMLVAFTVYRAYVVPGEDPPPESVRLVEAAADRARATLPEDRHATLQVVGELALGRLGRSRAKDTFVVRFQQVCGPVMAKGVEDTACYRWFRLSSLNEVGGRPEQVGVSVAELHAYASRLQRTCPDTMTTLSTHDTKRSEDVRARLAVLSELPDEWALALSGWRSAAAEYRPPDVDANAEYLMWQTIVGTWPIDATRLRAYLEKAAREAKLHTSWTEPDDAYERALDEFATAVLADEAVGAGVEEWVRRCAPYARVVTLGQKLLQITMPGVPDVYQGCELPDYSLVDPDNRRPVDYAGRAALLQALDVDDTVPAQLDGEKLLVTSRALRLRREHPDWFGVGGAYEPVDIDSEHAVAFFRGGQALTVVTRLAVGLERAGGFNRATLPVPPGAWTDVLTGRTIDADAGAIRLADLLDP